MFCGNCGKQIPDQSAFCPGCGSAVMQENSSVNGKNVDHKKVGIIAVVATVLLVFLLGSLLFGRRSEEKVIKEYVKASCEGDAKTIWKLLPKDIQDVVIEEAGSYLNIYTEKEFIEYAEATLESTLDQIDETIGKGWKYTYEITDESSYDKMDVIEYNQDYREMGATNFKASQVKDVDIKISVESADGSFSNERTMSVTLVKIGRSWYIGEMF